MHVFLNITLSIYLQREGRGVLEGLEEKREGKI